VTIPAADLEPRHTLVEAGAVCQSCVCRTMSTRGGRCFADVVSRWHANALIRSPLALLALGPDPQAWLSGLWGMGGMTALERWAADGQRDATKTPWRACCETTQGGEVLRCWPVLGFCFAYGFFHAAASRTCKILIGGLRAGPQGSLWGGWQGWRCYPSMAQAATAPSRLVYERRVYSGWSRSAIGQRGRRGLACPARYVLDRMVGIGLFAAGGFASCGPQRATRQSTASGISMRTIKITGTATGHNHDHTAMPARPGHKTRPTLGRGRHKCGPLRDALV